MNCLGRVSDEYQIASTWFQRDRVGLEVSTLQANKSWFKIEARPGFAIDFTAVLRVWRALSSLTRRTPIKPRQALFFRDIVFVAMIQGERSAACTYLLANDSTVFFLTAEAIDLPPRAPRHV